MNSKFVLSLSSLLAAPPSYGKEFSFTYIATEDDGLTQNINVYVSFAEILSPPICER